MMRQYIIFACVASLQNHNFPMAAPHAPQPARACEPAITVFRSASRRRGLHSLHVIIGSKQRSYETRLLNGLCPTARLFMVPYEAVNGKIVAIVFNFIELTSNKLFHSVVLVEIIRAITAKCKLFSGRTFEK